MGESKRRSHDQTKLLEAEAYFRSYMSSLVEHIGRIPADAQLHYPELLTVGRIEIWPCLDAAVVVVYEDPRRIGQVEVKSPLKRSAEQFISQSEAMALYDATGRRAPWSASSVIGDMSGTQIHFSGYRLTIGGAVFKPRYGRLIVRGWNVEGRPAQEIALQDVQSAYAIANLQPADSVAKSYQEKVNQSVSNAEKIADEFEALLSTASREEELQQFITQHPELLYPEHIHCYPKMKLGAEYVTDYVYILNGYNGLEHVFVELERANKKVVTDAGQFTAHLTQAKNQLLDWEQWVNDNRAYLKNTIKTLNTPVYHLVFGRTSDVDAKVRGKLQAEFNGNKRFSTYDDVLLRFRSVVTRIKS